MRIGLAGGAVSKNERTEEGGYQLADGRVTLVVLPWKISSFNGAGIE